MSMYVLLVPLVIGAVCVAFFTLLFAVGAFVGLGSVGKPALASQGRTRAVAEEATAARRVAPPARRPEAVAAGTVVATGAAYAPA